MNGKVIYSLNKDWKFQKAGRKGVEIEDNDFGMFSDYTKTGTMLGEASDSFCDANWQTVTLPHDWLVGEEFTNENCCQGCKPRGAAWYRKCFFVPEEWNGKRLFIKFDGISAKSTVILNNIRVAQSESAYTEIYTEITEMIYYGQPNLIAVYTDNYNSEGWWYDGCGIYRNTWLIVSETSRFKNNGVFVSSKYSGDGKWQLNTRVETENALESQTVSVTVLGAQKSVVAKEKNEILIDIENPPLWDLDNPQLVEIEVSLKDENGNTIDSETIMHGFREIIFDTENGCTVNGKSVKLKGVCLHADHAAVGVAMTYEIQLYRLKRLKEMGCNAIRTSHNPQSPEFYRACDELGFAVMDEIRHFSAAKEELAQLRTMVRRDRNHPCVFFWSMFNEEPLQCSKMGEKIAKRMKAVVDREDGTRAVSGGMNGPLERDGAVNVVDIMGFNYLQYGYDDFHRLHPNIPIVGSETVSHLVQRDSDTEYKTETVLRRTAYGTQRTNDYTGFKNLYKWSSTTGEAWKEINTRSFVSGGFVWTGIDYRGESTWPGVIADFGAMDICCFPKDNFYWNQAMWRDSNILNSTRYTIGETEKLLCYSNAQSIDVFDGAQKIGSYTNSFYTPTVCEVPKNSTIKVVGYFANGEAKQLMSMPEGKQKRIKLVCESDGIVKDSTAVFNAYILDENQNICKSAHDNVYFSVKGGEILGVGNGDTCSHEIETADTLRLFHGCAQVIVRAGSDKELTVTAHTEYSSDTLTQAVKECKTQYLKSCKPWIRICPWRMSDILQSYPEKKLIHDMMFNWIPTTAGAEESEMMTGKHGFACFAGNFTSPDVPSCIYLNGITGTFDLYLNGEIILSDLNAECKNYVIEVPERLFGLRCSISFVFTCNGSKVSVGDTYVMYNQ